MNRDDIIRMAREAQMSPSADGMYWTATLSDLEKFAAAEREACAKVCEQDENRADDWIPNSRPGGYFANAIRARGQA
jgi:hypothetical protein